MSVFRRSRRRRHLQPETPLQRIEQGEGGERALQDWLDRSRLAYLFLDQTPLTMPATHRAEIKRPDFLVAIDGIGTVAIDAKAKAFIGGHFVLDASERRRLDGFESEFGMPVWYACFPPAELRSAYLFRNRDLMGSAVAHDPGKQIIRAPIGLGWAVDHVCKPFARALQRAAGEAAKTPIRNSCQTARNIDEMDGCAGRPAEGRRWKSVAVKA